jgi:hypothetical protein
VNVNLDITDLIRLVKGSQPDYGQMGQLKAYGQYWEGCTMSFVWDSYALAKLSEEQLWEVYKIANESSAHEYRHTKQDVINKEIGEVEAILKDGLHRGSQSQIEAARKELERLKSE